MPVLELTRRVPQYHTRVRTIRGYDRHGGGSTGEGAGGDRFAGDGVGVKLAGTMAPGGGHGGGGGGHVKTGRGGKAGAPRKSSGNETGQRRRTDDAPSRLPLRAERGPSGFYQPTQSEIDAALEAVSLEFEKSRSRRARVAECPDPAPPKSSWSLAAASAVRASAAADVTSLASDAAASATDPLRRVPGSAAVDDHRANRGNRKAGSRPHIAHSELFTFTGGEHLELLRKNYMLVHPDAKEVPRIEIAAQYFRALNIDADAPAPAQNHLSWTLPVRWDPANRWVKRAISRGDLAFSDIDPAGTLSSAGYAQSRVRWRDVANRGTFPRPASTPCYNTNRVKISVRMANTYQSCPHAVFLRHIEKVDVQSQVRTMSAVIGQANHAVIDQVTTAITEDFYARLAAEAAQAAQASESTPDEDAAEADAAERDAAQRDAAAENGGVAGPGTAEDSAEGPVQAAPPGDSATQGGLAAEEDASAAPPGPAGAADPTHASLRAGATEGAQPSGTRDDGAPPAAAQGSDEAGRSGLVSRLVDSVKGLMSPFAARDDVAAVPKREDAAVDKALEEMDAAGAWGSEGGDLGNVDGVGDGIEGRHKEVITEEKVSGGPHVGAAPAVPAENVAEGTAAASESASTARRAATSEDGGAPPDSDAAADDPRPGEIPLPGMAGSLVSDTLYDGPGARDPVPGKKSSSASSPSSSSPPKPAMEEAPAPSGRTASSVGARHAIPVPSAARHRRTGDGGPLGTDRATIRDRAERAFEEALAGESTGRYSKDLSAEAMAVAKSAADKVSSAAEAAEAAATGADADAEARSGAALASESASATPAAPSEPSSTPSVSSPAEEESLTPGPAEMDGSAASSGVDGHRTEDAGPLHGAAALNAAAEVGYAPGGSDAAARMDGADAATAAAVDATAAPGRQVAAAVAPVDPSETAKARGKSWIDVGQPVQAAAMLDSTIVDVSSYIETYVIQALEGSGGDGSRTEVLASELNFSAPFLNGAVEVIGSIDRLEYRTYEDGGSRLVVVEVKTDPASHAIAEKQRSTQLRFYLWVVERMTGVRPLGELQHIRSGGGARRLELSDEDFDDITRKVTDVARGIVSGFFPPRPARNKCTFCPLSSACAHARVSPKKARYKKSPPPHTPIREAQIAEWEDLALHLRDLYARPTQSRRKKNALEVTWGNTRTPRLQRSTHFPAASLRGGMMANQPRK